MDTPIEDPKEWQIQVPREDFDHHIFELIHHSETIKCEVCDIFIKKCGMKAHRRSRKHKAMEMLTEPNPGIIQLPPKLRRSPLLI